MTDCAWRCFVVAAGYAIFDRGLPIIEDLWYAGRERAERPFGIDWTDQGEALKRALLPDIENSLIVSARQPHVAGQAILILSQSEVGEGCLAEID
jgi:hypothetical protein